MCITAVRLITSTAAIFRLKASLKSDKCFDISVAISEVYYKG